MPASTEEGPGAALLKGARDWGRADSESRVYTARNASKHRPEHAHTPQPRAIRRQRLKSAALPQEWVVGAGLGGIGHRLLARFCLIRSACARLSPAMRARRIAGPRP